MQPHSIQLSPLQRRVELVNVPFHYSAQIQDETETTDDRETDNETGHAPGPTSSNPNETGDDPGSSSDCDEIPMIPCDVTLITD